MKKKITKLTKKGEKMTFFQKDQEEQRISSDRSKTETLGGSSQSSKPKTLFLLLFFLIVVFLAAFAYFRYQTNLSSKTNLTISSPSQVPISPSSSVEANKKTYLGLSFGKKYFLVDFETGEKKEFLPAGYTLVNQHDYYPFPEYLFLQKEKQLFFFSLKNQKLSNLSELFPELNLEQGEEFRIFPSISEKDKFYISIEKYEPLPAESIGISKPVGVRAYFFDASQKKLTNSKAGHLEDCYIYDSKNRRFFAWKCGEGIGNSVPLYISSLDGNKLAELVSLKDYGYSEENLGAVDVLHNNEDFILLNPEKFSEITVINTINENIQKEIYRPSASLTIDTFPPYSAAIDRENKTIVIGGADRILLLRYNNNNQIIESKSLPEKEVYAGFIFLHQGKLIYKSKDGSQKVIRIVNLSNFQKEKTIPLDASAEEEITLISF